MGATGVRQFRCDLCGKLELGERRSHPNGWLCTDKQTICDACVETILRKPVDALVNSIDVTYLPRADDQDESFRGFTIENLYRKAIALTFAVSMLREEVRKVRSECNTLADALLKTEVRAAE